MELTRNFSLQELIKSDTAIRKGINNNPSSGQIENSDMFSSYAVPLTSQ